VRDGALWRHVALLEELGCDSLWLSDSAALGGLAPLPTLAAVAARTERLKLGTNVLVLPPRNPILLARELATVDVLSGGRLLPAGGLGIDLPTELEAMGVAAGERTSRMEESIAIIKALWTGERVTRHGVHWSLTDVALSPTPLRPKLEFWLGGTAPAALRRIGRVADGWIASFAGPDQMAAGIATIQEAAAACGRTIDDDHYGTTLFAVEDLDALPAATAALMRRTKVPVEDHVAVGAGALRSLLERFRAVGATKFVVIPVARDHDGFTRDLFHEAIEPVEAAH
jgi:probable F420-dependent oxidoreductase